jgi:hypothetical protein
MSMPIEAFGPDSVLMKPIFTLSAACAEAAIRNANTTDNFLISPPD